MKRVFSLIMLVTPHCLFNFGGHWSPVGISQLTLGPGNPFPSYCLPTLAEEEALVKHPDVFLDCLFLGGEGQSQSITACTNMLSESEPLMIPDITHMPK